MQRQNGKLILCDGADVGNNLTFEISNSLQCQITNRQTLACDFRGGGPITKWGGGVTVATGVSTSTGMMRIYEGVWFADGAHTLAGNYMVSNNAVLGGIGVVAPSAGNGVTVDGTLAPGSADGACGALTLGSAEQATTLNLNGTLAVAVGSEAHARAAVYGDVAFGGNAAVAVAVLDDTVWQARRDEALPLLTWTGTKTGAWTSATALPAGWKIRENPDGLFLVYAATGTLISVQ